MRYEEAVDVALRELVAAQALLREEIARYPTPISGCDAQFNRLLSDRARIARAIEAVEHQPFVPTPRQLEPGSMIESR